MTDDKVIYEQLVKLFGVPCDCMQISFDWMHCADCGEVEAWRCWERYFKELNNEA